jgi:hypothetical protein
LLQLGIRELDLIYLILGEGDTRGRGLKKW